MNYKIEGTTIERDDTAVEVRNAIRTVYKMLWDVLALHEATDNYNNVPKDAIEEDIWDYMGNKLLNVRKESSALFLGNKELSKKMEQIIDETEFFVRRYERPGVVKRWKKINNNILFFECAFDIMENYPQKYKEMCRGMSNIGLSCYPDQELVNERKEYFKRWKSKIEEGNLRYSEDRIFQNELLRTLTLVFENDFAKYL